MENNQARLSGKMANNFVFSHAKGSTNLYRGLIETQRLSGAVDIIPVIVSESMINTRHDYTGDFVEITGQFRSYNLHENGKSKLLLFLYAYDICTEPTGEIINSIVLNGFLCKKPVYRKTPLGRRITDITLAVNCVRGSDYLPCICWGDEAQYISYLDVGDKITLQGRIQSREYQKKQEDGTFATRVAYEVSVLKILNK